MNEYKICETCGKAVSDLYKHKRKKRCHANMKVAYGTRGTSGAKPRVIDAETMRKLRDDDA